MLGCFPYEIYGELMRRVRTSGLIAFGLTHRSLLDMAKRELSTRVSSHQCGNYDVVISRSPDGTRHGSTTMRPNHMSNAVGCFTAYYRHGAAARWCFSEPHGVCWGNMTSCITVATPPEENTSVATLHTKNVNYVASLTTPDIYDGTCSLIRAPALMNYLVTKSGVIQPDLNVVEAWFIDAITRHTGKPVTDFTPMRILSKWWKPVVNAYAPECVSLISDGWVG